MSEIPQRPEGALIEGALAGRSIRKLAPLAGLSDTRWRQIVKGWQTSHEGGRVEVRAPAGTLARMAQVVGLSAEDLVHVGRADAAEVMRAAGAVPEPGPVWRGNPSAFLVVTDGGVAFGGLDEARVCEVARSVRGVVVQLPVVADYRAVELSPRSVK